MLPGKSKGAVATRQAQEIVRTGDENVQVNYGVIGAGNRVIKADQDF